MAAVEVLISSRCTIKPLSTSQPHLRKWKLSMFDQLFPNAYVPFILFYPPSPTHLPAATVAHLKLSLSHALTKYYPLAGRLYEATYTVDCGDQGIDFFEAQAPGIISLADLLLQNPGPDFLQQLVPCGSGRTSGYLGDPLLAVQATVFNCGGVSLGLNISHKIVDGVSYLSFLQSWAASAITIRDATQIGGGDVVLQSCYFPPLPLEYLGPEPDRKPTKRTVQRRFIIDGPRLAALRSSNGLVDATHFPTPTRVEVVTGLFWSAIIRARTDLGPEGKGLALHMVNLRKHVTAPAAETLLGNFSFPAILIEEDGEEGTWRRLGLKLRNAARELNYESLQAARGPGRLAFVGQNLEVMARLPTRCVFSSWCRFPVYELDFGWGKPVWVAFGRPVVKHTVFMVDRKDDKGVEAWVSLEQEEMDRLIKDEELLSHFSLT